MSWSPQLTPSGLTGLSWCRHTPPPAFHGLPRVFGHRAFLESKWGERGYTLKQRGKGTGEGAGEGPGLGHSLIFTLHLSHQRAVVPLFHRPQNQGPEWFCGCPCGGHKLMAHWDPSPALSLHHVIPLSTAGQHQAKEPADPSPPPPLPPGLCTSIRSAGQHGLSHRELGGSGQGPVSTGTPARPLLISLLAAPLRSAKLKLPVTKASVLAPGRERAAAEETGQALPGRLGRVVGGVTWGTRARPAPEDWKLELRVTRAGQAQVPGGCQGRGGRDVGLGSPPCRPGGLPAVPSWCPSSPRRRSRGEEHPGVSSGQTDRVRGGGRGARQEAPWRSEITATVITGVDACNGGCHLVSACCSLQPTGVLCPRVQTQPI